MKQNIVLISGKQGSGKTTLAKAIKELVEYPYIAYEMKFADVIYEMHDAVWSIMKRYNIELKGVKDGRLLQLLGTEWGRDTIDIDVWPKICRTRTENILSHPTYKTVKLTPIVVIDDCRFQNEFNMFSDAVRVRLECPDEIRKQRCEAWRDCTEHPSEVNLDSFVQEGRFELVLHSDKQTPEEEAKLVLEAVYSQNRAI